MRRPTMRRPDHKPAASPMPPARSFEDYQQQRKGRKPYARPEYQRERQPSPYSKQGYQRENRYRNERPQNQPFFSYPPSSSGFQAPSFRANTGIIPHQLQGVFMAVRGKKTLYYTKNLVPGMQVYGERLSRHDGAEFREWDVSKSKLGAAIAKGISQIGIKPGSAVLYLGCASGTTASHVSDIVGCDIVGDGHDAGDTGSEDKNSGYKENEDKRDGGCVFALDVAPRPLRDIIQVCAARKNMSPILADAHHPEQYFHRVTAVDVVFQDVAQKDQVGIFLKNCAVFLKNGGFGLLAVKARSIDVTRKPSAIFSQVRQQLEQEGVIVDYRNLEPFEKDHCLFVWKKK